MYLRGDELTTGGGGPEIKKRMIFPLMSLLIHEAGYSGGAESITYCNT